MGHHLHLYGIMSLKDFNANYMRSGHAARPVIITYCRKLPRWHGGARSKFEIFIINRPYCNIAEDSRWIYRKLFHGHMILFSHIIGSGTSQSNHFMDCRFYRAAALQRSASGIYFQLLQSWTWCVFHFSRVRVNALTRLPVCNSE